MTVPYPFFTNLTSFSKSACQVDFCQRPENLPQRKKKLQQTKKEHFSWKTSIWWSGHFLLQLRVGLAQAIILPPRLCVDRPILALPSTALSAKAIAASFAGVLHAVPGEFQDDVSWAKTILMSSFCLGFTSLDGGNTQVSPCEHLGISIRSWFQIFFLLPQNFGEVAWSNFNLHSSQLGWEKTRATKLDKTTELSRYRTTPSLLQPAHWVPQHG